VVSFNRRELENICDIDVYGGVDMIGRLKKRLVVAGRMVSLRVRGRVRHHDRFGLSYWIWDYGRALSTRTGEPRTDDSGVVEQLRAVYRVIHAKPGRAVDGQISIDVGAYIGVISLAMADFGGTSQLVHSFEADDLNFGHLQENIFAGRSKNISAHKMAISDHVGTAVFTRNQDHGTNHLGDPIGNEADSATVYAVPVTTLDSFAEENDIDTIDVLKIDVEGSDINVLKGADRLLSGGHIGAVIVEVPLSVEGRIAMVDLFLSHGYSTAYIVRNSAELIDSTETSYSGQNRTPLNMIATRREIAEQLGIPGI
jgi:FkbM family methyltransferase